MFFRKKSPTRLYYPTRSKWYSKPRPKRRASLKKQKNLAVRMRERIRAFMGRSVWMFIGSIFGGVFIILLAFSAYFSVTHIQIERESFHVDSSKIMQHLTPFIGRNLVFFPRSEAAKAVLEHFPEFSDVRISKSLPGTLKVSLVSHPAVANLRAYYLLPQPKEPAPEPLPPTQTQQALMEAFGAVPEPSLVPSEPLREPVEQRGLINQAGQVLFDQEENLELITIVMEGLTQPLEDRQQVISSEHMEAVLTILTYFETSFDLGVTKLFYLPTARELHLQTPAETKIWLSLERDYKEQLGKLSAVYKEAGLDKEPLAYIDLRVNEKVIYCLRGEECDR